MPWQCGVRRGYRAVNSVIRRRAICLSPASRHHGIVKALQSEAAFVARRSPTQKMAHRPGVNGRHARCGELLQSEDAAATVALVAAVPFAAPGRRSSPAGSAPRRWTTTRSCHAMSAGAKTTRRVRLSTDGRADGRWSVCKGGPNACATARCFSHRNSRQSVRHYQGPARTRRCHSPLSAARRTRNIATGHLPLLRHI